MIICDTQMAKGVPFLEAREKSHFLRVEQHEWKQALEALDAGRQHEPDEAEAVARRPKDAGDSWAGGRRAAPRAAPGEAADHLGDDRLAGVGPGQRTKSAPFGHALVELAEDRPEIVGMTADLSKYTDLHIFAKEFPDRFYQMGMAEQLLMLAAGGMAHEGFVPFVTTYAVFASRRTYDFISQGIAEEGSERQDLLRPAGPDHGLRPEPPGDRGHRDLPRHAGPDDRRSLRRPGHRAGHPRHRGA